MVDAAPDSFPRGGFSRLLAPLTIALAALILTSELFVPPILGMANNGDFEKVMGYAGFRYPTNNRAENYRDFVVRRFALAPIGFAPSGYLTSETLIAGGARLFVAALPAVNSFDIRILGVFHALLFLLAIGALVSTTGPVRPGARVRAAILLVFVFTDAAYGASFNSF